MPKQGGLTEQQCSYVMRQIVHGLTALHECGIVHRDLKVQSINIEDYEIEGPSIQITGFKYATNQH